MVPEFSVIIPVLHEGAQIQACLHHLSQIAADSAYEVIVVDGDRQGSTLLHLPPACAHLKGIVAPQGRGRQMNAGARIAQGRWLLFLHADARLPPQALNLIGNTLHPVVVGGAFDLQIASSRWVLHMISRIASWRSRLTRIPYGDQAIFIKKEIFEQFHGYPEIPIMEDVALMRRLKQQGYTIQILRSPVQVSPRRWEKEGIVRCTLRNWSLLTLYYSGAAPESLANWYRPGSYDSEDSASF